MGVYRATRTTILRPAGSCQTRTIEPEALIARWATPPRDNRLIEDQRSPVLARVTVIAFLVSAQTMAAAPAIVHRDLRGGGGRRERRPSSEPR